MPKRKGILFTEEHLHPENPVSNVKPLYLDNEIAGQFKHQTKFATAKLHFDPAKLPPGKRKAQEVFLKGPFNKKDATEISKITSKLIQNGLPALKTGVVHYNGKYYLAIEAYTGKKQRGTKRTKLIPINPNRRFPTHPVFLKRLTLSKHKELIKKMAQDVAKLHNLGINTNTFDYYGFHLTKTGYSRKIMDTGRFFETDDLQVLKRDLRVTLHQIKNVWGESQEMKFFEEILDQNLEPHLKEFRKH